MRVYIAGPMTGKEAYNLHAFQRAQREWRIKGHEAIIPFESNNTVWERHYGREFDPYNDRCDYGDPLLRELFAEDVAYLLSADGIVLLRGWEASKGAMLELRIAHTFKMPVFLASGERLEDEKIEAILARVPANSG